jgi:hypothetical protein
MDTARLASRDEKVEENMELEHVPTRESYRLHWGECGLRGQTIDSRNDWTIKEFILKTKVTLVGKIVSRS